MKDTIDGSCLCGKVTFSVKNEFRQFHLCHCIQCRKVTGSAHASNLFTSLENFQWKLGAENTKRFNYPGRAFSKVFCIDCGSGLPFSISDGKSVIVPAGSLDDEPNIVPQDNIFWSERALWYEAGIKSPHFDGFPKR